jgi:hypothetical protein
LSFFFHTALLGSSPGPPEKGPALATRAPEAGCQAWDWGRAFRRASGLLGRRIISYEPNDQAHRVVALSGGREQQVASEPQIG